MYYSFRGTVGFLLSLSPAETTDHNTRVRSFTDSFELGNVMPGLSWVNDEEYQAGIGGIEWSLVQAVVASLTPARLYYI